MWQTKHFFCFLRLCSGFQFVALTFRPALLHKTKSARVIRFLAGRLLLPAGIHTRCVFSLHITYATQATQLQRLLWRIVVITEAKSDMCVPSDFPFQDQKVTDFYARPDELTPWLAPANHCNNCETTKANKKSISSDKYACSIPRPYATLVP